MKLDPYILELVKAVINSDLPKATREEIVRFWTLIRVTDLKTPIEAVGEDETDPDVGVVERPSVETVELRKNKSQRGENKAMNKTLKAIDKQDE